MDPKSGWVIHGAYAPTLRSLALKLFVQLVREIGEQAKQDDVAMSRRSTCNSPSPLLDIIHFGPLRIVINLTVLKRVC